MPEVTEKIVIAYDPDFDAPSDLFNMLGGRRAFVLGLIASVLCLMSIGFVAMFGLLLSGKTITL